MMEKMMEKGKSEMEEEKKSYAEYEKFAETTTTEKARAISEASERIEALSASIDKAAADVDRLSAEIAEHDSVIDSTSTEMQNATSVRQKEAADFGTTLKDYDDSISAIGKAMTVLKEQPSSRPAALLQIAQLDRKISPTEASQYLDAFLKGHEERAPVNSLLMESQVPEAAGYEFQSGGVVSLLEKLEDQFKEERNTLKMEELKKKNSFKTLVAGLDSENSDAKKDKERKLQEKATISEQKATDEGELTETKATMAEDIKYKKDLETSWKQKSVDFQNRQQLRAEELEAIGKATEIIGGGAVAGNAEKHLPSLLSTGTALASLKGPSLRKVAQLLQDSATRLQSENLAALAARVTADPMEKVKEMIQGMIARMEKEAADSETKFQWCKEELSQNEELRGEKNDEVEKLQAQIEKLKSSIQLLGKDVVSLNGQIKESQGAMTEATAIRQKEKKENTVAIQDAKAAQSAVAEALSVLNEFYAKAAALVQTNAPYEGMTSASGGVIGMIEVIQSDFARLEAETSAAEKQSSKEYETFMEDSKLDVAGKEKDVEHKTARKESESQKVKTFEGDLGAVQKELDAAMKTFEQLKPQCADAGASYAERKAKRDAEIKSLEEALEALKVAR